MERRRRLLGAGHHAAQCRLQRHPRPVGQHLLGHDPERLEHRSGHPGVYGIGMTSRGSV
ncbi:hypothetical protein SBRY_140074 [Actinacidiphila bryophytorum]|uniref:Uncharacterized protein n=1 Tax=Actinacidiphila bryophytorum TaxID=1436133 RepID=A0A9W4E8Z1_9ACTN|nr:hypothetical protein SBRY_140074 [Actinacidiphila bryophytorum]